jgi:hypothetical protein
MRTTAMRHILALTVASSMLFSAGPLLAGAAPRVGQAPQTASLAGTAKTSTGQVVPDATVQVRNLTTGQLTATTTSNAAGEFKFEGLPPGNYTIEIVNPTGQIIATSAAVSLAAGAAVAGVTVSASAAAIGAAGAAGAAAGAAGAAGAGAAGAGAAVAGAAAAGAGVAAGVTTAVVVTTVAAAAGVAAAVAVAANNNASPSR